MPDFRMSAHYLRVRKFMSKIGCQRVEVKPVLPILEVRKLRAALILEETLELLKALGFEVQLDAVGHVVSIPIKVPLDLAEIVDGIMDVRVVTTGTLIACGVPDIAFCEEVDNNNLKKFGPGHKIREDGKLIKPPDHEGPRISELLFELIDSAEVHNAIAET